MPTRVAVIGGGVSGLAAFWALENKAREALSEDSEDEHVYEAHLYEGSDYLGGHARSVPWRDTGILIDVGFALFNPATYPNFTKFLTDLDVETSPTRITFGLSREGFEWSSKSLSTLFPNWRAIFSIERWLMLFGIWRFNLSAGEVLDSQYSNKNETVGAYLRRNGYPESFEKNYLFPLLSSIWIHDPESHVCDMPIFMVVQYLWNHRLLYTFSSPVPWLSVKGGAKMYVDKIVERAPAGRMHTCCKVGSIVEEEGRLRVSFLDGLKPAEYFDHIILATHAPEALGIMGENATAEERRVLSQFKTTKPSTVILHSDISLMPQNRNLQSAWNYHALTSPKPQTQPARVSLTADMGQVMQLDTKDNILATLNPCPSLIPKDNNGRYLFRHPVYDALTSNAQQQMKTIQGARRIWFAGAWMGHGFHEDGFTKGIEAATRIRHQVESDIDPRGLFPLQDWKNAEAEPLNTVPIRAMRVILGVLCKVVWLFCFLLFPSLI